MLRVILAFLLLAGSVSATTYYVRTDGSNGNAGTANTSGGAWLTIDYAASQATAGDIIRVQTGTYAERVSPNVNGTNGSPITFVADGVVTADGFDFDDGAQYFRVIGFVLDAATTGATDNGVVMFSGTTTGIEFWHNTIRNGLYNGFRASTNVTTHKFVAIGNIMHTFGVGNGSGTVSGLAGDDHLIGWNEMYNSHPDAIRMAGDRVRYIGNYIHSLSEESGGHTDVFQVGSGGNPWGWEQNVIEATFYIAGGAAGDEHVAQVSYGQGAIDEDFTQNIVRRNVWHNTGSGFFGVNQSDSGPITHIYLYNNTEVDAVRQYTTTRYGDAIYGTQTDYIYYVNNLLYEAWGTSATANLEAVLITVVSTKEQDYNLAYDPDGTVTFHSSWTAQSNEQSNANPQFTDKANDDFRLGATSAARDTGGSVTAVNEANGTGTTFTVDNAGWFRGDNTTLDQYSGNLVVGDTITVGTDVLTITSISGNDITVSSSFTWADNDPVYFGSDTTPDIGAYPYGATLLTAATVSDGTVTPTGDARMVVQFRDGIPFAVDNAAPFAFTHQSGDLYRAYALHPQATTWVEATDATPTGSLTVTNTLTVGP